MVAKISKKNKTVRSYAKGESFPQRVRNLGVNGVKKSLSGARAMLPLPKLLPVGKILPSMITLSSIVAGMSAILFASAGAFEKAVVAIMLAAVFDGFDGRVARMFRASSQFGVELDSLADSISFGVAPAFVVFFFSRQEMKSFAWVICLVYAICCVLRLARFNVMTGDEEVPEYWHYFFTGVPAPAGALLSLTPLTLYFATDEAVFASPYVCLSFMLVVAMFMISRVPTLSLKHLCVPKAWLGFIFVMFAILIGLLCFHFWTVMSLVWVVYFVTIPLTVLSFLKMKRESVK